MNLMAMSSTLPQQSAHKESCELQSPQQGISHACLLRSSHTSMFQGLHWPRLQPSHRSTEGIFQKLKQGLGKAGKR